MIVTRVAVAGTLFLFLVWKSFYTNQSQKCKEETIPEIWRHLFIIEEKTKRSALLLHFHVGYGLNSIFSLFLILIFLFAYLCVSFSPENLRIFRISPVNQRLSSVEIH